VSARDLEGALSPEALRFIRAKFGGAAIEDLCVLTGGRSGAQVFSVRIAGRSYALRVPSADRDDHLQRSEREITSMQLAAARGIAPELCHADRSTGITLSVKVEGILSGRERALAPGRIERVVSTVRGLHDGPRLAQGPGVIELMDYFDGALRARGAGGIPAALAATVREAAQASQRFGQRAPCHGDLNPANVLETAERAYLIDWEMAGEGDPFLDIGQLGVFSFFAPGARAALLSTYLGRAPTRSEDAHATLARVTALGSYAASFTMAACCGGAAAPEHATHPRPISEVVLELARGTASTWDVALSLQRVTQEEAASDAYRAALREAQALTSA
jgi:aminoglycoside phosphotransferase (APT) family kinase protein